MTYKVATRQGDREEWSPQPEQPVSIAGKEGGAVAATHPAWRFGPARPRDGGQTWGRAVEAMDSVEDAISPPGGPLVASLEAQLAGQTPKAVRVALRPAA